MLELIGNFLCHFCRRVIRFTVTQRNQQFLFGILKRLRHIFAAPENIVSTLVFSGFADTIGGHRQRTLQRVGRFGGIAFDNPHDSADTGTGGGCIFGTAARQFTELLFVHAAIGTGLGHQTISFAFDHSVKFGGSHFENYLLDFDTGTFGLGR